MVDSLNLLQSSVMLLCTLKTNILALQFDFYRKYVDILNGLSINSL